MKCFLDGDIMLNYVLSLEKLASFDIVEFTHEQAKEYLLNDTILEDTISLYLSSVYASGKDIVFFMLESCDFEAYQKFAFPTNMDYVINSYDKEGLYYIIMEAKINGRDLEDSTRESRIANGLLDSTYIMDQYFYRNFKAMGLIPETKEHWKYQPFYFEMNHAEAIEEIQLTLRFFPQRIRMDTEIRVRYGKQQTDYFLQGNELGRFRITVLNLEIIREEDGFALLFVYKTDPDRKTLHIYPYLNSWLEQPPPESNRHMYPHERSPQYDDISGDTIKSVILCPVDDITRKNVPLFFDLRILSASNKVPYLHTLKIII